MIHRPAIRFGNTSGLACLRSLGSILAVFLAAAGSASGVAQAPAQAPSPAPAAVLDRAVAVVNDQVILASDIDDEIRLSVLDPANGGPGVLTRRRALEQLIARALIQQQIHQEDAQATEPSLAGATSDGSSSQERQAEVDARLTEIRKELPACVRQGCASDAGWKAFLAAHGLTQKQVESYLRYRIEILRFIEERFRPGIRISPQQIDTYYHGTLLPQYTAGETIPPLDQVAPRIEEILFQQQVNLLFDDWLDKLRNQGDIEVLDPALEAPQTRDGQEKGSQ
jgi:hypothetical protein